MVRVLAPNPIITIKTKSVEIINISGDKFIIPFRSISYYVVLQPNISINAGKRIKLVTIDGTAHSIVDAQVDTFQTNYTNWLNSTVFTL